MKIRFIYSKILPLALVSSVAAAKVAGDVYTDAQLGLSVTKPKDWKFTDNVNSARVELNRGGETASRKMPVRTAFEGRIPGGAPTDMGQCILDDIKDALPTPLATLTRTVTTMSAQDRNFRLTEDPALTASGALEMAHATYVLTLDDGRGHDTHRAYVNWYFRSGQTTLRFQCTALEDSLGASISTFEQAAASLSLAPPADKK